MIKIFCAGNGASAACDQWLTCGTVGAVCEFSFDSAWDGLRKTAVFIAGDTQRDVVLTENQCIIPWEVLTQEGAELIVGVHGVDAGGTMVVPTIYANVGAIRPGADPSGDPSADPTLPVWAQIRRAIGELSGLETTEKENLVAAINEAARSALRGGGGGTTDHNQLTNRDALDQHPISAITGLQTALDDKQSTIVFGETVDDVGNDVMLSINGKKLVGCCDEDGHFIKNSYQKKTIADPDHYFATDTVEGALQEIGAELAGINTLIGSGVIV